ncbi:MAG TPA: hypothetical protein VE954_28935 [Oligoflexus sp.]|nr:hypothetical protein [Oligoflexus sp.]
MSTSAGAAQNWFESIKDSVERFKHLRVTHLTCADEAGGRPPC